MRTRKINCVNGPVLNEAVKVEAEESHPGPHPVDHDQRRFDVVHCV